MSAHLGQAKRDLVARRVAQADRGLAAGDIEAAVDAVAVNARTLDVLAQALSDSPEPLGVGAPPSIGRLVVELRARGSTLPDPVCALCGRARLKLTGTDAGALCPRCRHRHLATACSSCGVRKPVGGRGPQGEPLCARCAPRPRRVCSACGRTRIIARRARGDQGDICDSCYKGPLADCLVCGRRKPCNFVSAGRPICVSCSPRRSLPCAHCARPRPPCAHWPEGPVCEPCYRAALSRRGRCADCAQQRRLMSPPGPAARLCATCAGVAPLAACRTCGIEDRPHRDGQCVRCALATRAAALIGNPNGPLRPVYEAIVAAAQPYSAHNWLRSSAAAAVLSQISTGQITLSHEALDAHPHRRGADYLRHLLVAAGALAPRNDELTRLETWVADRLATVGDPTQRRLLRSYATWRLLRRARVRAERTPTGARTPTRHAKTCLNMAIAFLDFLQHRHRSPAEVTQADIDTWLSQGPPSAPRVADFLDWAATRKHTARFAIPAPARRDGPTLDTDHRWATARRLLHDESIELTDRVAGSLVLLYGQQLSRIIALTTDQITTTNGQVHLHLGDTPIDIPSPLDTLICRLAQQRRPYSGLGSPKRSPWLFSGLDPGRPLTAYQLGQRLKHLGIEPAPARRAALTQLASQLPAAMIARLLNITPATAVRWVRTAGGDWNSYAAQLTRQR